MRLLPVAIASLGALVVLPSAPADHAETTLFGSLPFSTGGWLSRVGAPCMPGEFPDRIDGYWLPLDGFGEHGFRLVTSPRLDGALEFRDADCEFLAAFDDARLGEPEEGVVPPATAFVLVHGSVLFPPGFGEFALEVGRA